MKLLNSTSALAIARSFSFPVKSEQSPAPPCPHDHQDLVILSGPPYQPPRQTFDLLDHLSRVPTKCWNCLGSGRCQQDYPGAGSGKGSDGEKEYYCGGSGKCYTCGGTGWIYTRTVIAA